MEIRCKKLNENFFSTHYLERSERPKRSLSIDQLERSERLKGSWSTYYLERSERLKEFWSNYIIEQSERLKLFPSAHNLERIEKLKRSWSISKIERSEKLKGSWSTHYLERSERLKGSISFICNISYITLIPQIVNFFFVKTEKSYWNSVFNYNPEKSLRNFLLIIFIYVMLTNWEWVILSMPYLIKDVRKIQYGMSNVHGLRPYFLIN